MAKKTDEELGAMIRAAVALTAVGPNESITKVKIVINSDVTNSVNQTTYPKGSKGRSIDNYDADNETIVEEW